MGGARGRHKRARPSLAVRPFAMLGARLTSAGPSPGVAQSGRSSGVEHNLAKVGVEGSNPFARSSAFSRRSVYCTVEVERIVAFSCFK